MDVNQRCPDWVLSNRSNVNVAIDRSWFTKYTPFSSYLEPIVRFPKGSSVKVAGIGTVKLIFVKGRLPNGAKTYGSITLDHVLHAPGGVCNVLGRPFIETLGAVEEDVVRRRLLDRKTRVVAVLEELGCGLVRLKLMSGQAGPSKLKDHAHYFVSVNWPDTELARCNAFMRQALANYDANSADEPSKVPQYSQEEKSWLNTHYGNEYHFLLSCELKIYDEEDRAEGRLIVRALMEADEEEEEEGKAKTI